jgi:hypothetical protein
MTLSVSFRTNKVTNETWEKRGALIGLPATSDIHRC